MMLFRIGGVAFLSGFSRSKPFARIWLYALLGSNLFNGLFMIDLPDDSHAVIPDNGFWLFCTGRLRSAL